MSKDYRKAGWVVMFRNTGVTLIEMLVAVSIMAILLAVGIPGMQDYFSRNRLDGAAGEFMGSLAYARSEAIRRGSTVSVCKSNNGTACSGSGVHWESGWIVFSNLDNDSPAVVDAGETVLKVGQALPASLTLRPNNNFTNYLSYRSDGKVNNIGTFVICNGGSLVGAKSVSIIGTGRPRMGADTNNNGIPEKEVGGVSTDVASCTNP